MKTRMIVEIDHIDGDALSSEEVSQIVVNSVLCKLIQFKNKDYKKVWKTLKVDLL